MKDVVVTDNQTCYSVFSPDDKILVTSFRGIVNYSLMKDHISNVLRFAEDNEILGAIVDFRKLRGSFYKLFDTIEQEAYPKFIAHGFKVQALLVSDDILTGNLIDRLSLRLRKKGGVVQIFHQLEDARQWVIAQTEI